jgi:hypothetical protein
MYIYIKKNTPLFIKIFMLFFLLNVLGYSLSFYIRSGIFRTPLIVGHFCEASMFSPTYPFYRSPYFLSAVIKTSIFFLLYQFGVPKEKKESALILFILINIFVFLVFSALYDLKISAFFGTFSYEYLLSKQHFKNMYIFPASQILLYILFYLMKPKKLGSNSAPSTKQ